MAMSEWRESITAAGVIASLIFVGYEIRQNNRVARGQTRHELAVMNQEWLLLRSTDAELNDIWRRVWGSNSTGEVEPAPAEIQRATWAMRLMLRKMEDVYLQYAEGLIDESALNSYGLQAVAQFQGDRFREFWVDGDERSAYHPEFVRFFEERLGLVVP